MTTYHEPPLQSRRASRRLERGDQPAPPLVVQNPVLNAPPAPPARSMDDLPAPRTRAEARRRAEAEAARRAGETVAGIPFLPTAEARTAPPAAPPPLVQPPEPNAFEPRPVADEELRPDPSASAPPASVPPASAAPASASSDVIEHTLTRRELRAIREAQGLAATSAASPPEAPPAPPSVPAPPPASPPAAAAPAETAAPVESAPVESAPVEPVPPIESVAPAVPTTQDSSRDASWSSLAAAEEPQQAPGASFTRSVGGGSSSYATNALILPASVDVGIDGPISGTGELFITGSVQLPRSLGSTGANPDLLESSDLDHLLDPGDVQVPTTDSQPVRAIRAVSTHTSSGGMIAGKKQSSNRGLTVLIVAAGTMALLVGTILVVAIATGQL